MIFRGACVLGVLALAFIGVFFAAAGVSANIAWKEEKSDHFIVYYTADESFAQEVKRKSEVYYEKIASELGYARYSNFWQWDNRVKIYIYPSEKAFHEGTGQPAWSKGMASYDKKAIYTFARSDDFLDGILPHEMTHLIFRDFVGFKGEIPLWMDEGVAQWQEPKKRALSKDMARYLIQHGRNYSIREITSLDVRGSQDTEKVNAFYMQAVSLVDFLVKKYGSSAFTDFCRQLRDGKSLNEALRFSYPQSIRSLEELEKQWHQYVTSH